MTINFRRWNIILGSVAFLLVATPAFSAFAPVVNYKALQAVGLTGQGITVQIDSSGIKHLQAAEQAGLLNAGEMTVVNPNPSSNGSEPSHAVFSAMVVHRIAPGAKIVICNVGNCYGFGNYWHANIIVDNSDGGVEGASFAYGNTNSNFMDLFHVGFYNALPGVLFFLSGSDTGGVSYFQGNWAPVQATVGGAAVTVEDFGTASSHSSDPAETLSADGKITNYRTINLHLQWQDTALADHPTFVIKVYDSGTLIADSTVSSEQCSVGAAPCVYLPPEPLSALPLKVYVILASGSVTGNLKMKLFVGNGAGRLGTNEYTVSYVTPGSVSPFIPGAGPNVIITGGAGYTLSGVFGISGGSSVGPLLGFDTQTRTFHTFKYPTLTGDICTNFSAPPWLPNGSVGFCGNSNSAPELAAVAALLEQAGLTPTQVEQGETATADNPVAGEGVWGPVWGHGVENPLGALTYYITLPSPAISGASGVSGTVGQAVSFAGSCTVPSSNTLGSYKWAFGDGATATGQNATHTYTRSGSYVATLNCSEKTERGVILFASHPAQQTVNIGSGHPPNANLSVSTLSPTVGQAVSFTAECIAASSPLASFTLKFGDGSTVYTGAISGTGTVSQRVSHTYTRAGTDTAKLTCTDNQKNASAPSQTNIDVHKTSSGGGGGSGNPPFSSGGGGFGLIGLGVLGLLGLMAAGLRRRVHTA